MADIISSPGAGQFPPMAQKQELESRIWSILESLESGSGRVEELSSEDAMTLQNYYSQTLKHIARLCTVPAHNLPFTTAEQQESHAPVGSEGQGEPTGEQPLGDLIGALRTGRVKLEDLHSLEISRIMKFYDRTLESIDMLRAIPGEGATTLAGEAPGEEIESAAPARTQWDNDDLKQAWQDLWGDDGVRSLAARKKISEASRSGNSYALSMLSSTLDYCQKKRSEEGAESLEEKAKWAVESLSASQEQGYREGRKFLGEREYASLINCLGNIRIYQANTSEEHKILALAARQGSRKAIMQLRVAAADRDGYRKRQKADCAAEALAHAYAHLNPGDYKVILKAAAYTGQDSQARRILVKSMQESREGAMDAVFGALNDTTINGGSDGDKAAEMLGQAAEVLGEREIQALRRAAVAGKDNFLQRAAACSLIKASEARRPGAREALGAIPQDILQSREVKRLAVRAGLSAQETELARHDERATAQLHEKLQSEDYDTSYGAHDFLKQQLQKGNFWILDSIRNLDEVGARLFRDEALKKLQQDFTATEDRQLRARLAPYVIESSNNGEVVAQALEAIKGSALNGEARALDALAFAVGSSKFNKDYPEQAAGASKILQQASGTGQGEEVLEAILRRLAENEKWKPTMMMREPDHGHSRMLEDMGMAASHLDGDDTRLELVREALRKGLAESAGVSCSVAGFRHIKNHLTIDDLEALSKAIETHLGTHSYMPRERDLASPGLAGAAQLLREGLKTLPLSERTELAASILGAIRKKLGYNNTMPASKILWELREYLGREDIALITEYATPNRWGGSGIDRSQAAEFFGQLAGSDEVQPEIRMMAARGITGIAHSYMLSDETRRNLVNFAEDCDDNTFKENVINNMLPQPPRGEEALKKLALDFSSKIFQVSQSAYEEGDEDDPMYELGRLMRAQYLGTTHAYRGQVDVVRLNRRIQLHIDSHPSLKRQVEGLRAGVLEKWQRHEGRGLAGRQVEYLKSETFEQRLKLLEPEKQRTLIQSELSKLYQIAPEQVEEVSQHIDSRLLQHEIEKYPLRSLQHLSEEQRSDLISNIFTRALGGSSFSGDVAKKLGGIINKLNPDAPVGKILQGLVKRHGNFGELKTYWMANKFLKNIPLPAVEKLSSITDALSKLEGNGTLGTTLSALSATALVINGWPQSAEEWVQVSATGLGIAGNLGDIANVGSRLPLANKLFKPPVPGGAMARLFGCAAGGADIVGAALEGKSAYDSFKAGDGWAGALQTTSAVTGAVSGGLIIGSTLLAGGVTAPVGAAVLVLTGISVGASMAAGLVRESDELRMLRGVDCWTKPARLYYAIKNAGTSDQVIIDELTGLSYSAARELKEEYRQLFDTELASSIKGDTSGNFESTLLALLNGRYLSGMRKSPRSDARSLRNAISGWGTNDAMLIQILTSRSKDELQAIERDFKSLTGENLKSWIESDTGGWYETALLAQLIWARE